MTDFGCVPTGRKQKFCQMNQMSTRIYPLKSLNGSGKMLTLMKKIRIKMYEGASINGKRKKVGRKWK